MLFNNHKFPWHTHTHTLQNHTKNTYPSLLFLHHRWSIFGELSTIFRVVHDYPKDSNSHDRLFHKAMSNKCGLNRQDKMHRACVWKFRKERKPHKDLIQSFTSRRDVWKKNGQLRAGLSSERIELYPYRPRQLFDMIFSRIKLLFPLLCCVLVALVCVPGSVECAKKSAPPVASPPPVVHEPVIEEVTQKQLERILQEKDYVAVYWCKWKIMGESIFIVGSAF